MPSPEISLHDACRVVIAHGFTPVKRDAYERLREWLDKTDGWPPRDWQPVESQ